VTESRETFLPLRTKLWFGVGQVAEGLKGRAFETFLFFYYEQVLGLSAWLSATALIIAVAWDAISDPMTGSLSDATRTRWGRRHPFMYGAALPLALFFVLLFSPPSGLGQTGLFVWLTLFSVLGRTALTAYSIPHFALGSELSTDYHERTEIVAFRSWFQQIAAWSVVPISFATFFAETPSFPNGQLDPSAYPPFAFLFALLMAAVILLSAWGTHDRIATLPQASASVSMPTLRSVFLEMVEALRSSSLRFYVIAILVFAVSNGLQRVLDLYMRTYFWRLEPGEIFWIGVCELGGVCVGIPFWTRISRRIDKKKTFIVGILIWGGMVSLPPFAFLFGLFPELGSPIYVPLLAAAGTLSAFGSCGNYAVGGSMMADLVDEHELDSGHRRAGILFGVINFAAKFTPVAGITLASVVLGWVGLERGMDPTLVPASSIRTLALAYGPFVFMLTAMSAFLMSYYSIDQARLEAIQTSLGERGASGEV
jgi:GPH family glycoside/pentoside/hexuronide:cation symporter